MSVTGRRPPPDGAREHPVATGVMIALTSVGVGALADPLLRAQLLAVVRELWHAIV